MRAARKARNPMNLFKQRVETAIIAPLKGLPRLKNAVSKAFSACGFICRLIGE